MYQYSFSNLCAWYATSLGEISRGHVLVFSSLSFDLTQKNLWTPLFNGGTLVLHEASFFDPKVINNTIAKHRIDYINCAPSAFYPLLEQCNAETKIASLKAVYLGGEPIAWARVRDWFLTSDCRLWNSYGPTECTDVVAAYEFDREDVLLSENAWNPPVGNALANIHLFVLDESLKPCPQGVAGDLYIGGECVGAGYFGNASLSREKFIPHPHFPRSDADEKIYKTGDKAYWNESGGIYFIGRDDDQVKIRGYRISLSEIERHLGMLTSVKRAVVLAQNGSLAAYVVPENLNQNAEQKETLITRLLEELGTRLPEYMVPSRLMLLDAIPLSPNGKIDKKALPAIDSLSHLHELTSLTTDTQRKLAGIWAKVLSIPTEAIGANSHFLRLGGHSLLVVQLASEIRREFAIEIEISALFESAVLEHTAKQIDSIQLQHYLKQREAAVEIKSEGSL